jgi:hypothetical protein
MSRNRGEFRQSYKSWGVTGYLPRSFVNIIFRNLIQAAPKIPGKLLYGIISQWHLLPLRYAITSRCAELALLMAVSMGLSSRRSATKKSATFPITPNALSVASMEPHCAFGFYMQKHSDEKLYNTMQTIKELRCVLTSIGAWESRLRRIQWHLQG